MSLTRINQWIHLGAWHRCLFCGLSASTGLCTSCRQLLRQRPSCRSCALPLPQGAGAICGSCLARQPIWQQMSVAGEYEGILATLLSQFKFERRFWLAGPLSRWIAEPECKPDFLMSVPMHWKKRWQRGFNQSALLAWQLGQRWRVPLWNGVRCCRYTATQHQLDERARRRNLRHAYRIDQSVPMAHIGIVDDIVTTGATVDELARLLRRCGVQQISVYAVARTPRPGD